MRFSLDGKICDDYKFVIIVYQGVHLLMYWSDLLIFWVVVFFHIEEGCPVKWVYVLFFVLCFIYLVSTQQVGC